MLDAALTSEFEVNLAARNLCVTVLKRRQAVGMVVLRVFIIADAHERQLHDLHDRRENFSLGQTIQLQIALDGSSNLGKRFSEGGHAAVLVLIADLAPF